MWRVWWCGRAGWRVAGKNPQGGESVHLVREKWSEQLAGAIGPCRWFAVCVCVCFYGMCVWRVRNIQLALFGAVMGLAGCLVYDGAAVARDGFFQGYNGLVWTVILLQASNQWLQGSQAPCRWTRPSVCRLWAGWSWRRCSSMPTTS